MLNKKSKCKGCGIELEIIIGETDPYNGSTSACWNFFNKILEKEFSKPEYFKSHRMTVDAYMVQHANNISRAARQSLWVHMIALYLTLEENKPANFVGRFMGFITKEKRDFEWLSPPSCNSYTITVSDVLSAEDPDEHFENVKKWATDVWSAWQEHHLKIRDFTINEMKKI